MHLLRQLKLARIRRDAYRQTLAELETYTERQLNDDLGLNRFDISRLAAETAEQRVAAALHKAG